MQYTLTVNESDVVVDVDEDTPLLWVLRDNLKLTGTKFGCGIAACGACTVHVDGVATRSCVLPVSTLANRKIETIEHLSDDNTHPVQLAWLDVDVPQCGYCQSGMIMAAASLLASNPKPTNEQIDTAMTNVCRCGTYNRVRKGIHRAVEIMAAETLPEADSNG
jgi:isoquinoline 1-oxidoreductase alpha subunit